MKGDYGLNPKTKFKVTDHSLCVDTSGLQEITQSGRKTAVEIGIQAGARIQIGRRVLWNVEKVKRYIDAISTE